MSRSIVIVTLIACWSLMGGCTASLNTHSPSDHATGQEVANRDALIDRVTGQEAQGRGALIARAALNVLGTPYRYGGNDINGFDCSGLVQYAHTQADISIPRTTATQYKAAKKKPKVLRVGDVLFFRIRGKVSHNGIYLGKGRFIHAPSTGKNVSIASIDNSYFKNRLVGVIRFH